MQDNNITTGRNGTDTGDCWAYKPAYGIVHPMNCSICRSYMAHVVVANRSDETSFRQALNERETRVTTAFLDGVHEGKQLQQEHDTVRLLSYREERDQALKSLEQHQGLLDAAKNELNLLRDQILALQIAFGELQQGSDTGISLKTFSSKQSNTSSMERMLLGSSFDDSSTDLEYTEFTDEPPTSLLAPTDLPTIPDQSTVPEDGSILHRADQSLSKTPTPTSGVLSESISMPPSKVAKDVPPPEELTVSESKALTATSLGVQYSTSVPTRTSLSPRPLTTLAHLQMLMKAAHGGDESSLTRVRAFCAAAHQTPRDQRTELQRYALIHWRNRPRSASDPGQSTSSHGTISVEIFVDASSWGIGFVMDGHWLSWKFSDYFPFLSKTTDSSWTEMLAVEVGLWTVVHWANVQEQTQGQSSSLSVLVRSDNAGVVRAIEKQQTNHPPQQEVLQRILELVAEYNMQLTMKWISSLENLADNPSRGIPGLGATLLPYAPPVPLHLSALLQPVTTFT